jgi:predicted Zn-dependent protease
MLAAVMPPSYGPRSAAASNKTGGRVIGDSANTSASQARGSTSFSFAVYAARASTASVGRGWRMVGGLPAFLVLDNELLEIFEAVPRKGDG